jgi:hypothetical protein
VGNICQRHHGHYNDHHILVRFACDAAGGHATHHMILPGQVSCANMRSFCITNLEDYLNGSDFPIIDIIYDATNSRAATCVLGGLLILLLFFSTVTTVASASRQVWAFSRDRGFPFSVLQYSTLTTSSSWLYVLRLLSSCLPSTLGPTLPFKPFSQYPTQH